MNYFYLVIIDVLNKYVWVESLRDKNFRATCVIKIFQRILAKSEERVLIYLQTDKGKKFVAQYRNFLKRTTYVFSGNVQFGH